MFVIDIKILSSPVIHNDKGDKNEFFRIFIQKKH